MNDNIRLLSVCKMFLFRFLKVILFSVPICLLSLDGMASDQKTINISWEEPRHLPVNEDEYLKILYFDNAAFTDSLATVPVYNHRVKNPVPLYAYRFAISDKQFVPVSASEAEILDEAGFRQDSITLHHHLQSARKERHNVLWFYPFRYDPETAQYEKLMSFKVDKELVFDDTMSYTAGADRYADESALATGDWYKLCVEETGVYRLEYEDLEALGLDLSAIQKSGIRLLGNGSGMLPEANDAFAYDDLKENAIYVSGDASDDFGQDDYILFYGRSPDRWLFDDFNGLFRYERHLYDQQNCYFIGTDGSAGKRIEQQAEVDEPATHEINSFRDYAVHQRDLVNLIGSGRVWFGETFDGSTRAFTFDFPNLDTGSTAVVEAYVAARSSVASTFSMQAGDNDDQIYISSINPADYNGHYVRTNQVTMPFDPPGSGEITVELTYNRPQAGARGWLNYLVVNADRQLRFSGPQMRFRDVDHIGEGNVLQYNLQDTPDQVTVWDVTDHHNVMVQQLPDTHHFRLPGDSLREFVAFDGSSFMTPELGGAVPNQNLHAAEPHDMVIVAPENFTDQAERLADFRMAHSDLSVKVVTTNQVYNEFSSGVTDISAIRNFMKMLYDRAETAGEMPRYLLLFGNGTYDNKDLLGYGGNLIPTYQSYASLAPRSSYMTDDYFGLLDDSEGEESEGILDIGIGRLPVRTVEEAEILVDKIIRYDERVPGMAPGEEELAYTGQISNYADWRNTLVFIADDGDNNRHFNDAEKLAGRVSDNYPVYNVDKIYLDAYQQVTMAGGARYPEVNRAINDRVNKGALLINYIGHGGVRGLAQQRVVTFDDIGTWNNKYNMPVFMTATCQFSSFDQPDPDELSAGVRIIQKPVGGSAALFTTTRLAWSGSNLTLNENFMDVAFSVDDRETHPRLGDLIRIAKQESGNESIPVRIRNFVLLGDPSMQMAYPEYRVETEEMPDTLKAFQEVTISGYVTDSQGNQVHDYNGVLFPTMYDKKAELQTLGNNPDSQPDDFELRNSVLYKGKASVTDGAFDFTFVMPKDIAYQFGEGKISYYLDDGQTDGHGYYTDFQVGGSMDDYPPDHQGPEIDLFLNDTTFVSGDYTNENPILLAILEDESGINVTGSIGHDIVAYLNNNSGDPIRLNDYYEADMDTYQRGRVVYPFFSLDDGHYTLTLRAWDIHNNPATETLEFIVSDADNLTLNDLMNYPNPFSSETYFTFKHNQAFAEMQVEIDIFDLSGRLVNTIQETVTPAGYQATPIRWDGISNDGRPLGNGVYIYRVTLTTPDGIKKRASDKLMILR